jgi:hypothetical protein
MNAPVLQHFFNAITNLFARAAVDLLDSKNNFLARPIARDEMRSETKVVFIQGGPKVTRPFKI